MSAKIVSSRRRVALLSATALVTAFASTAARAQDGTSVTNTNTGPVQTQAATPAVPQATEQIEVTGTRIQNTNANSENPITVVTAKQIAQSSAQNIEDVLQKLPSIGTSGLYGSTNNGGIGLSCTDIRNLGINRVLVLVDGKRFVHDSDGVQDCVDLNNIPLQMVDHIDVLKDGASSLYGADAVSGVVNIVMKRNFSGTTATLEGNLPTLGGGTQGELSVTSGMNFDQGNFLIGLDYLNRAPILQGKRNWANRVNSGYIGGIGNDFGSGSIPGGRIVNANINGPTRPAVGLKVDPLTSTASIYHRSTDTYDFAPQQDLVGGLEKEGLTALGHVDFNEYMTGYIEGFFTHKTTTQQLAPEPVYTNTSAALPTSYFIVPHDNPYLASTTYNGVPISSLLFKAVTDPVTGVVTNVPQNALIRKRLSDTGNREYVQDTNTIEATAGLRGTLPYDVSYDAYYTYGHSSSINQTKNSTNVANLESLVGFSYTPSTFGPVGGSYDPSVCPSSGCNNPFALNSAGANYVAFILTDTSRFNLRNYGLDLTKKNVVALPYGPLGVAFGFDHREESGNYFTDNLVATGLTNESPQAPTGGGFNVTEVYGEVAIPILADVPFAKELTADLSGRHFHYNTFGSGDSWNAKFNWTPVSDVRFRGAIGTSFRQPSVNELYTSPVNSSNAYTDPCDTTNGALAPVVAANCASNNKLGKLPGNFQSTNTQVNTIIGGNPDLQPETARTETAGVVLKPHWVRNTAFTVDYFRTKINNSISSLNTQDILNICYNSTNFSSVLCQLIGGRGPTGELVNLSATNQNLGVTLTSGIDAGLTYNLPLGDFGAISLNNELEYVLKYESQNLPDGPFTQYAGKIIEGAPGNYAYPRAKDNNTISFANGPITVAYTTRFISGMDFYADTDPTTYRVTKTANVFYHDLEGTYTYHGAVLTVGCDNILNQTPPFVPDAATNTNSNVYDVIGRTVYAKLSYHF